LLRYSQSNVNLDTGVNHQYKELFKRNIELDTIINLAPAAESLPRQT
jgi:hypothetical protein